jgi:hypothetical protein
MVRGDGEAGRKVHWTFLSHERPEPREGLVGTHVAILRNRKRPVFNTIGEAAGLDGAGSTGISQVSGYYRVISSSPPSFTPLSLWQIPIFWQLEFPNSSEKINI